MPYISEHAVRLREPDRYTRFRRENDFAEGVDAIWGITEDGKVELQGLRFNAERYSIEAVRKWLKEHNLHALAIEPATRKFSADDVIERDARLMVAGDYPDKGVTIDENALQQMAESGAGAPVIVEHKPTLFLGWVRELWRKGQELWGRLALKREANALIEESGTRGLSVGLIRTPDGKFALHEVSLTSTPRVENAQLFTETPSLYIVQRDANPSVAREEPTMQDTKQVQKPTTQVVTMDTEAIERERQRADALEAKVRELTEQVKFAQQQLVRQACARIAQEWQRTGKLTPAAAKHAEALLMGLVQAEPQGIIQFSETGNTESLPALARELMALIESLPAHTPQRATRFVSVDDLEARKREIQAELQRLGFSKVQVSDELVQAIQRNGNGGAL